VGPLFALLPRRGGSLLLQLGQGALHLGGCHQRLGVRQGIQNPLYDQLGVDLQALSPEVTPPPDSQRCS